MIRLVPFVAAPRFVAAPSLPLVERHRRPALAGTPTQRRGLAAAAFAGASAGPPGRRGARYYDRAAIARSLVVEETNTQPRGFILRVSCAKWLFHINAADVELSIPRPRSQSKNFEVRRRLVRGRRRNASMPFLACIVRPGLTPNPVLMGRRRTTFDLRGFFELMVRPGVRGGLAMASRRRSARRDMLSK